MNLKLKTCTLLFFIVLNALNCLAQFEVYYSPNIDNTSHAIVADTIWQVGRNSILKRQISTGKVLAQYTPANSPVPVWIIDDVCVDKQNRVWYVMQDVGVGMIDGTKWHFWHRDTIPSIYYNQPVIAVDSQGTVWTGGTFKPSWFKNGRWESAPDPGTWNPRPLRLKAAPDGRMWAISEFGVVSAYSGTKWDTILIENRDIRDIAFAPDGSFYTGGTSVFRYSPGSTTGQELPGLTNVMSLAVKSDGSVWAAGVFDGNVSRYDGSKWVKTLNRKEVVPVRDLSFDASGNLWASGDHVGKYDGTNWNPMWHGPVGFEKIIADSDSSVLIGYVNTVSRFFPKTGRTEYLIPPIPDTWAHGQGLTGLVKGSDSTFFIGGLRGRLHWFDGTKFVSLDFTPNDWDGYMYMAADQLGNVYIQNNSRRKLTKYNVYTKAKTIWEGSTPAFPWSDFGGITVDGLNRFWVLADSGLVRLTANGWRNKTPPDQKKLLRSSLYPVSSGKYTWFFSVETGKIVRFDGQNWESRDVPLQADEQGERLCASVNGWVWLLTTKHRIYAFNGYSWEVYDETRLPFVSNWIAADNNGDLWLYSSGYAARLKSPEKGKLKGMVISDTNLDCAAQPNEKGLSGISIILDNGKARYEGFSDINGHFSILAPAGTYTVFVQSSNVADQPCISGFEVSILLDSVMNLIIPVQEGTKNPLMSVSIGTNFLRRCSEATYAVQICNDGNGSSDSTLLSVQLPTGLTLLESDIAPFKVDSFTYFFIGKVPADDCVDFNFKVKIGCQEVNLGESLCIKAHVYPDTLPGNGTKSWHGAAIVLKSECKDNKAVFYVENVGEAVNSQPLPFTVLKNQYLFQDSVLQIFPGNTHVASFPADGSTWRFSIAQEPGHPLADAPSLAIEGCVSGSAERSNGFASQFSSETGSPFENISCETVIGSFDPNDKLADPLGVGTNHFIAPNQKINYKIRFQNTGTDTAFRVAVRDTLHQWLDWKTFSPGLSSHPYRVEKDSAKRIINFVFDNILLPDSNVNKAQSHGFVQFSISLHKNTPLKTTVSNTASIYFDFNAPVWTGVVNRTVDTGFVVRAPLPPDKNAPVLIKCTPNPSISGTWLSIEPFDPTLRYAITIHDSQGNSVYQFQADKARSFIPQNLLPTGLYWASVLANGKSIGYCKFIMLAF